MSEDQTEFIWKDGALVPWAEAQIHGMSHVVHYGSSIFEGIRFYDTPEGPSIFRLDDHLKRFFDSARIYRMLPRATAPELRASLEGLLARLEGLFPQWPLQGGWVGRNVWIVKPGTNSKGSGVECMSTLPELLHHCDKLPNRLVQKYVERPLLLFSGRKWDIRQWVLLRSASPLRVFMFSYNIIVKYV